VPLKKKPITPEHEIPPPNGLTVETFLKNIKKDCVDHATKFQSWEELMTLKTAELKKREIPTKQRKWILRWVEKYKQGVPPRYTGRKAKFSSN